MTPTLQNNIEEAKKRIFTAFPVLKKVMESTEVYRIKISVMFDKALEQELTSIYTLAQEEARKEMIDIVEKQRIHGDNSRNWEYVNACEDILSTLSNNTQV